MITKIPVKNKVILGIARHNETFFALCITPTHEPRHGLLPIFREHIDPQLARQLLLKAYFAGRLSGRQSWSESNRIWCKYFDKGGVS